MNLRNKGVFFAVWAALASPLGAQTIRVMEFNQPKRDHIDDYRAAEIDYAAAMRRVADSETYSCWLSLTGTAEVLRIFDYATWAERDQPNVAQRHPDRAAEIASIEQRARNANQSFRTVAMHLVPDASLPLAGENPRMLFVRWVRVSSGHLGEYEGIVKNEILPGLKKAGIKSFSVWQVDFGAPTPQLVLIEGIDNWAFFDRANPLKAAVGQEAYERTLTKAQAITVELREDLYRFRPELSYLPSKK
jgi:hypothetical protein